ncbi:MAG: cupin domain-containing protein [Vicinamibacterales bacterium]|nr:cupin domain-containing protein [Vicinamibacterales bacterium]
MNRFLAQDVAFEPADPKNFVGNARVKRLRMAEGTVVFLVEFDPGGRTNWHAHSAPQLLLVNEGRGLVQKWGEPIVELTAGDAITIEPNEKHWHGAAPSARMAHFAVNLNLTTKWFEPVSDDQYCAS